MEEQRKVPQIRFKGFTDDWEQRKLFDVAEYRNGKAHENDIDEDGIYIVVNSKFVSTDGEVKKYSNKQNEPLLKNEIAFVLSDVPNGRAIAKTFLVEKSNKYTLNQRIAGITPHSDINPKFLSVTMNRNKYFLQFDDGVKQTNLSLDDMKKFEEFYPRKMEQDKIGEIFSNIDNLITLHQRKCDRLIEVKKSLLEKMFPKNSSKIPEIRFKRFTDDWEQRKVSDIFKVTRGYVLASTMTNEKKSAGMVYPVYSSQTKDNGLMGYYKDYLYEDAITWTTDGANAGTVNYRTGKFYCTNVCGVLLSKKIKANPMIAEALNKIAKQYVSYVGNPKLMNNVMADIELQIPKQEEEREQLSQTFVSLDNLITLHQRKLVKLKEVKKSMLEKMFVQKG